MFDNYCKLSYKNLAQGALYQTDSDDSSLKIVSSMPLESFRNKKNPVVRIHSSCFASEQIGSRDCDCNDQLKSSIWYIANLSNGIIFYLDQEGRGHGTSGKISIMNEMHGNNFDTYQACDALGLAADIRNYDKVIKILNKLNIYSIILISNNPLKEQTLTNNGIKVSKRVILPTPIREENLNYLESKKQKKEHKISLHKFDNEKKIYFYNPKEAHGYLSNLSLYEMKVNHSKWYSVEHFYKAHKHINNDINTDKHLRFLKQFEAQNGIHQDWEAIKISVMYTALCTKFTQHAELHKKLIKTGNAQLIEKSINDYFWGIGEDFSGHNWMGKLLMYLRDNLITK